MQFFVKIKVTVSQAAAGTQLLPITSKILQPSVISRLIEMYAVVQGTVCLLYTSDAADE